MKLRMGMIGGGEGSLIRPLHRMAAPMHTRIPAGHPEGFIEAFANLYRNFALHIIALDEGRDRDPMADYPGIPEGVRGMKFLVAVIALKTNNSTQRAV